MDGDVPVLPNLPRRTILGLALVVEGGMIVLAIGFSWLLGVPLAAVMAGTPQGWILGVAAAGPMLLLLWWSRRSTLGVVRRFSQSIDEMVVPLFRNCRLIDLLFISVLAGVGEELLFRGLLQQGMLLWLTPRLGEAGAIGAALLIASLLFGFAHCVSVEYVVFATVVGAFLGALFLLTGNLVVPIVAHALYDFVALSFLVKRRPLRNLDSACEEC